MATEYRLSYTAAEVDKRLGDIKINATNITNLQTALDEKADLSSLDNYCTKDEIDDIELIKTDDIDAICGSII